MAHIKKIEGFTLSETLNNLKNYALTSLKNEARLLYFYNLLC